MIQAPKWDRETLAGQAPLISLVALCVVLASEGYPQNPRKGDAINRLPADEDESKDIHDGTPNEDGTLVTSGSPEHCDTALGEKERTAAQSS